ncbi:cell wall anchor [Dictyobacter vulcani]|uniref:Cell wall anchor n=2 Tax=Dictyobacter vulcani TaxID=2607529 RepID=A0A5J4KK80_9CHLR|nr:cell wall anchor [Dictyobacter vulcani]
MALFIFSSASAFAAPADNAFVRVVHASPAAGTVDVFVDGNKLLPNFTFGTVTGYVSVPAGAHKIQVAPAGKGADAAVINETVSVNAGVPYTVAAIGTKDTGFGLQAFADDNMLSGGMTKVRVYHLSPNAGPVNVATGGNTVITGLTYKNASDYLTVPPAAYTFNVTATQANATVPVSATLKDNTVNSVFAIGLYKGDPALKFVVGTVPGVPGMPQTGSNPNVAAPTSSNSTLLWFVGAVALLISGGASYAIRSSRVKH